MATKPGSKNSLALMPMMLVVLALVGFLCTTYWQQQRDYQALQQELNLTRSNTKQQIEQIGSQAALRHSALLKMCEDVARLRDQVDTLQASLRDQADDLNRQGQKIHGKVERLDLETQQQLKALENIKSQLKDRTDEYMTAMINQERELAKLSAEKAIIAEAAKSMSSSNPPTTLAPLLSATTSSPAPVATATTASAPTAAPAVTSSSAPATSNSTPAALPPKPQSSTPIVPPAPITAATIQKISTAPAPIPVPQAPVR